MTDLPRSLWFRVFAGGCFGGGSLEARGVLDRGAPSGSLRVETTSRGRRNETGEIEASVEQWARLREYCLEIRKGGDLRFVREPAADDEVLHSVEVRSKGPRTRVRRI